MQKNDECEAKTEYKKKEQKEIKTNPFVHHQPKEKEWKDASKDVFVVPPHLRR